MQFIKKNIFAILFVLYILAAITLLVIPTRNIGAASRMPFRSDSFAHAVLFFPWSFFILSFKKIRWNIWILIGLAFGILMEFVQYFIPYRSFSFMDMLADAVGIVLGMIVFTIIYYFIFPNKRKNAV